MNTPDDVLREAYLQYLREQLSPEDLRLIVRNHEARDEAHSTLLTAIAGALAAIERIPPHTWTLAAVLKQIEIGALSLQALHSEKAQEVWSQQVYPQWLALVRTLQQAGDSS